MGGSPGSLEETEVGVEVFPLDDTREMVEIFDEVAGIPHSCFLDSSLNMPGYGRYSFIGLDPFLVLTTSGRTATLRHRRGDRHEEEGNPFDILAKALRSRRARPDALPAGLPPFIGGGIGYLAYELGRHIERLPVTVEDDLGLPEVAFCFYDTVISADHATGEKYLVVGVPRGEEPAGAAAGALARITGGARRKTEPVEPPLSEPGTPLVFESGFTRGRYIEAVRAVKEYILAGDVYQVNLSQRFCAPLLERSWDLYRRLRLKNAAPFSAYLNFGEFAVASSSPERFLKVEGRRVETRPIKGTRPRSEDPHLDERYRRDLLESAKDRAELSMIVDLERNDLGRVCDYGSVVVEEHAVLESYATVHHLVSTVVGKLHEGRDVVDLLKAAFPGGSITGAPKIRSMEIIDELEPTVRSVYTGAIGYLGFDGTHDLNVAIRTMIIKGGRVYFQVGGGIVAESEPEAEYQETLDKGKAMFESVTTARAPTGG